MYYYNENSKKVQGKSEKDRKNMSHSVLSSCDYETYNDCISECPYQDSNPDHDFRRVVC